MGWARHSRHQSPEAFRFSLPLVPAVDDAIHVRNEEFACFARFVFHCTQLLQLDAQQRYFPPHRRYRIGCVRRLWGRKYVYDRMNVGSSGLIRHAQNVPKYGLQTVNPSARIPHTTPARKVLKPVAP